MDKKYIKALGFDKILEMLIKRVSCEDTKKLILNLMPKTQIDEVKKQISETLDAHMLIARYKSPSFNGLKNVTNAIKRAESGGMLTALEILKVADVLQAFLNLYEFKKSFENKETLLDRRFNLIFLNKDLKDRIRDAIISEEEIADTASDELFKIRQNVRELSSKIREQLDKMIKSESTQKYLQDAIVTIREGRFVVPVKAEYRKEVSGLVHDTSSSGATVFIEPMTVVQANNEIKVLISKEKKEIERILLDFSAEVGSFANEILQSYDIAVELDMIFAKADLAYKMKACVPKINDKGQIDIKKARHPLIDQDKVVPTDIKLGLDFDTLIITGPNTGGKTVALKTMGLFTIMIMCGLLVPVSENSTLSVFKNVLCDIGDEQSIEQSLSTFSAHITNIIKILKLADNNSLVLLDELGAGTDPIEGAALARAILEELQNKGAKTIATTHYAELKAYAISKPGVENGCCEFDVTTLRPTYRLLIGVPGSSNAFAISEKLGMEKTLVNRAKGLISSEDTYFDDVIKSLEKSREDLEQEMLKAKELSKKIENDRALIEEDKKRIQKQCDMEIKKAHEKALKIVSQTNAKADDILREIDKLKKEKTFSKKSINKLQSDIDLMEKYADPVINKSNDEYILPRKLRVGDEVLIFNIDKKGTVAELFEDLKEALVKSGAIKTRVPIKDLKLLKEKPKQIVARKTTKDIKNKFTSPTVRELDLRGKTALEAVMELDGFIDTAICMGVNQLTIIHGKGTGVLRSEIQKHLKNHPAIKSFRLGSFGEGESGVTIAELK
ncbi:MAG: Endonuclease MutS2 [Eubacteriales bacterium SKADARSKE-1]|nr:Endonuclease MutS2 [Eubacteriales bacterium SKADARSKE-1]